ncbi:isoprenylcysteine carboxyl methyltransferase family protein [Oerskovia jenensis]|uniref:Methyltransferase n=1 Tax=Oerskovia jenensis TaxID=162169 RepID=A0ABS2LG74_9CELL|nr:isoprenylcysteine carboxyl methyltransferase family protein [Oerskovia jenensis]MBM7479420.1 methyltransferase [Oerskovia jenensis]
MLVFFYVVVGATALERLAELVVSARNARWSFARGGVESGRGHFPAMVALHTGLLVACVVEVNVADRPFIPWVGWPAFVLVVASQALRWWCITSLGPRWNTRVIVVPGLPWVDRGPYRWIAQHPGQRWFRHPNYVAVVVEGFALPLVHSCWTTALVFTVLNAVLLLRFRLPAEERALDALPHTQTRAPGPVSRP